jgi:hypothetical protein
MDARNDRRTRTEVELERCISEVVRVTVAVKARHGRRLAIPRLEEGNYGRRQEEV